MAAVSTRSGWLYPLLCVLLLPGGFGLGLVLGSCAVRDDPAPPIATEQQGIRLLRAVAANTPSNGVTIASLRDLPGIQLGLSEFAHAYPDSTDAQFAFLRWWGSRHQDIDIASEMRDAATLVPLLLPEADDAALEQALSGYPELMFVYDPPLHQPDSDVLAVFLARDSGLFKAIYNDEAQSIGGIQPMIVEQAMSRLILAARNPTESSLPIGLQKAGLFIDADQAVRIEEAWIERSLTQLRTEQEEAASAQELQARVLGQPSSVAGRESLRRLLLAIPLKDAVRQHPALKATITQAIALILAEFNYRDSARHEVNDWSDVLDDLYPVDAVDDAPVFRQSLSRLSAATQADVLPDQSLSPPGVPER